MKHFFLHSLLAVIIVFGGVMLSGCERNMLHPVLESDHGGIYEEDDGDITVQHTGDPFIHGDLYIPPPSEDEEEAEETQD